MKSLHAMRGTDLPETISVNDAIDAGYIGDDCYVSYQVFRFGKPTHIASFHYDTKDCGWFGETFFRTDDGKIRTWMHGGIPGMTASIIPAEEPMCLEVA